MEREATVIDDDEGKTVFQPLVPIDLFFLNLKKRGTAKHEASGPSRAEPPPYANIEAGAYS